MDGIKAILLDIDGTVLDTREFIYQAAEFALQQNGYPQVPRSKIAEAVGMPFEEFYFHILGSRAIDSLPLQTSHRVFQLEHLDLSFAFPGAFDTLTELKRRGYRLAAITSRRRTTLMPTLDRAGITELFDIIIAADDAPELKPSPVPLHIALDFFKLVPEEAAMVGDTDIDVAAGKAAQVRTVRVWYGFMGAHTESVKADFSIEKNITELLNLFPSK